MLHVSLRVYDFSPLPEPAGKQISISAIQILYEKFPEISPSIATVKIVQNSSYKYFCQLSQYIAKHLLERLIVSCGNERIS